MGKTCVAVDLGASGGRIMAGALTGGKIMMREIHRFKNRIIRSGGHDCWDIDLIFGNVAEGLGKLKDTGEQVQSIGTDSWAVDYVLLDDNKRRISPVYSYRDHRTDNAMEEFFRLVDRQTIYAKTGIQFMQFNTIYQLYRHVSQDPGIAGKARHFLLIPDYLNHLLCGSVVSEFTNATTTQLFNVGGRRWDADLIKAAGLREDIFPEVVEAGTVLGPITGAMRDKTGLSGVKIIAPATHDTASAVAAVPALSDGFAYISSGTWSLMGVESGAPVCTGKAMKYNFTNEGGAFGTWRILKNIMGLWLIQEVQRNYAGRYGFDDLAGMAEKAEPFKCLVNPNHPRFLNPGNMIEEIRAFCRETRQPEPESAGETARCIFESLAFMYRKVLSEIMDIQGERPISRLHIIGGGARYRLLNRLCASFTGLEVLAGPVEATATGNIAVQLIALGEIENMHMVRRIISDSFEIEKFEPEHFAGMEENWEKFRAISGEDGI